MRERKYLHPITPTHPIPAEMQSSGSGVVAAAEAMVVDEPKLKYQKGKGTAKTRSLRETETIAKGSARVRYSYGFRVPELARRFAITVSYSRFSLL